MSRRIRTIWRFGIILIALFLIVLITLSFINYRIEENQAIGAADDISDSYFNIILEELSSAEKGHDFGDIRRLIATLVESNPSNHDIRLVSHGNGKTIASFRDINIKSLDQNHFLCHSCHVMDNREKRLSVVKHEELFELTGGERIISITRPIFNETGCQSAACHDNDKVSPVLGLLETEFSMARVDLKISQRNIWSITATILIILLTGAATWFMVGFIIKRRIRRLVNGMNKLAKNGYDAYLDQDERDEFDLLTSSFNDMVSMLSYTLGELRKNHDYLEGVLESSADIIITVGDSGNIRTFNAGAEKALGYARYEVIGQPVEMLFDDPAERTIAIDKLQYTDNVQNYETRFKTRDGKIKNVLLTLSRFRNPNGEVIGTMGISKDITKEKRLQEQLIQSQRLAAIGQVFTGIQHTMKNMLNALKGGAYMVKSGLAVDNRKMLEEGWDIVQEGISSLTDMSMHMLRYVKDWKPKFESVDLLQLLSEVYRIIKQTGKDKGVNIELDIPDRLPSVLCDGGMIRSAVMDIVSNALDACLMKDYPENDKPQVIIGAQDIEADRMVDIVIRDNGCGMTREVKANIFTPFFSTKRKAGTGLGLSTTLRMINIHGGKIDVETKPDKGTFFRIKLPIDGIEKDKENSDAKKSSGS